VINSLTAKQYLNWLVVKGVGRHVGADPMYNTLLAGQLPQLCSDNSNTALLRNSLHYDYYLL